MSQKDWEETMWTPADPALDRALALIAGALEATEARPATTRVGLAAAHVRGLLKGTKSEHLYPSEANYENDSDRELLWYTANLVSTAGLMVSLDKGSVWMRSALNLMYVFLERFGALDTFQDAGVSQKAQT